MIKYSTKPPDKAGKDGYTIALFNTELISIGKLGQGQAVFSKLKEKMRTQGDG